MRTVTRKYAASKHETFKQILDAEAHHDHEIVERLNGQLCWKSNPYIEGLIEVLDLNRIIQLLQLLGFGKNSEVYRKLYRDMGYALGAYWDVFYWYPNNPDVDSYAPQAEHDAYARQVALDFTRYLLAYERESQHLLSDDERSAEELFENYLQFAKHDGTSLCDHL